MLEIPEARTIALQLERETVGKRVASVVAGSTPHGFAGYFGDPAEYHDRLAGKVVGGVRALSGQVELELEDMRVLFNDGVNIRYLPTEQSAPKKHQFLMTFEDGSAIVCTVQMYGGMMAFPEGAMEDNFYYLVSKAKPNPLSDEFDMAYFDRLWSLAKPTLSAKAFLATEQRIPGLGNGVLQDILFRAGVHPKSKLEALEQGDRERMYASTKETLMRMAEDGGRDTEKDLYGNPGGYRCILSKNTLPYACPQCGGGITKQSYLGGAVYFCASCQPLKK